MTSAMARLRELPEAFTFAGFCKLTRLSDQAAAVWLARWKEKGLIEAAGERARLYFNKTQMQRGSTERFESRSSRARAMSRSTGSTFTVGRCRGLKRFIRGRSPSRQAHLWPAGTPAGARTRGFVRATRRGGTRTWTIWTFLRKSSRLSEELRRYWVSNCRHRCYVRSTTSSPAANDSNHGPRSRPVRPGRRRVNRVSVPVRRDDPIQLSQRFRRQRQLAGGQVLAQMCDGRSPGDEQDVGRAVKQPRQRDLHRCHTEPTGDFRQGWLIVAA